MIAKDLERELSVLSARTPTELDVIGRELRKMGFSPTGGRGTSAPDIDEQVAANFLMAAAGAPKAVNAAKAVFDLRPLEPIGGRTAGFVYSGTFGDALAAALESTDLASAVDEVRVCHDRPFAIIQWQEGGSRKECLYSPTGDAREVQVGPLSHWGIIRGSLLSTLALAFKGSADDDFGWVGEDFPNGRPNPEKP